MENKQSVRIQTSILNPLEKKALVWLAERQPKWVTSDMLTAVGTVGALIIAAGYILSNWNVNFLWLSCFGLIVNWYGDSLDGSLARVRNCQRPIYGYYLDHTVDVINEAFMFIGVGLSPYLDLNLALVLFILYLALTLNVSINAHLKSEFKLTYLKLGPTEFRLIAILANMVLIFAKPLHDYYRQIFLFGKEYLVGVLDYVGIVVFVILLVIYLSSIIHDARDYSKRDPMPKHD